MEGFNDWVNVELRDVGSRANAFGGSGGGVYEPGGGGGLFEPGGGGGLFEPGGGGGLFEPGGGGTGAYEPGGGGTGLFEPGGGGGLFEPGGGGGLFEPGGGGEQDTDTFNSTVDAPTCLKAVEPAGAHFVNLTWSAAGSGQQIRTYFIWRTDTAKPIGNVTGKPPTTNFTDPTVKNGVTYTYFVTAALGADSGPNNGNQSGPSNIQTITINFSKGATGTPLPTCH